MAWAPPALAWCCTCPRWNVRRPRPRPRPDRAGGTDATGRPAVCRRPVSGRTRWQGYFPKSIGYGNISPTLRGPFPLRRPMLHAPPNQIDRSVLHDRLVGLWERTGDASLHRLADGEPPVDGATMATEQDRSDW